METTNSLRIYKDAVAIITGGASGIGRALGEELAQQGATVILGDRQFELAGDAAKQIIARGGNARAVDLDVTDAAAVKNVVDETTGEFGRLDFIFNNAGIGIGGEAQLHKPEDWYQVLDVNLRGVIHGVAAAYPYMIEQGFGHIVNTASVAGLLPAANMISYNTSKFAVVGMTTSLRTEAARYGVRVSVLCPGAVQTPILVGGAYGKSLNNVPKELVEEMWKNMRPMDANVFAQKTLRDIAKNKSIIIHPSWWRIHWWMYRLSPALGLWFIGRQFRAGVAKIEARMKELEKQECEVGG